MEAGDIAHVEYVAQLARHLASVPATRIPNPRRGAVAIVIRLVLKDSDDIYPEYVAPPPLPPTRAATLQSLDRYLSSREFKDARAQVLFIQRAQYAGDPWSGNIGFPGGKREPTDESDRATAERETREELGLELKTGFVHLGQLDDAPVYLLGQGIKMAVSPQVYLQTNMHKPELVLSNEVASAHWVDFTCVVDRIDKPVRPFSTQYQSVSTDIAARVFRTYALAQPWWLRVLSACVGKLHYTVLALPYTRGDSVCQLASGSAGADLRVRVSDSTQFATDSELHLWGLSLGMVAELVDLSLPVAPRRLSKYWSVASPWPQLGGRLWADVNWATNAVHAMAWTPGRRKPWRAGRSAADFLLAYFRVLAVVLPASCVAKAAAASYLFGRVLLALGVKQQS
ncbi:hypothetical protein GGF43_004216 [Coemansia sp. RSA 2618]|nr:hypothetical protein GGF43_004216 [Coemansia sp. RSA 2618]